MKRYILFLVALCMSGMSLMAQQTAQIQQLIDSARYDQAVQLCTTELKQYPKNGTLYRQRALANLMQEQYGKALQDMDMLLKYAKTSGWSVSEIYMLRAVIYYQIKDYTQSIADCTTAIKKDKKNDKAYAQRGALYYEVENYSSALADYQAASQLSPTDDDYLVEVARCMLQLHREAEARTMLTSITLLYPHNAEAWRLSAVSAMLSGETTKFIDQYIHYLDLNYEQTGQWGDTDLLVSTAQKDYAYLLSAVSKQINSLTDYPQAFYKGVRVRVYMEKGYYADAVGELNRMEKEENEPNPFILANRAKCYQNMYQYRKAVTDYNALIQYNSDYLFGYLQRGACYASLGQYEKAISDYTHIIENSPSYTMAYYARAVAHTEQHNYDDALADVSRCIELSPSARAYFLRGRLQLIQGDTAKATADFEQVLPIDTTTAGSVRQYALHYLGQDSAALAWMDNILVDYPSEGNYYDAACLNALMGRTEQALTALDKALSMGYKDYFHISIDIDLDAIRNLPRFAEILNKYRQQEVQSKFDLLKESKPE